MIVYKRNLTKDDFNDIEKNELLFCKDNNIAYVITKNDSYILKKYKIFNRHLIESRKFKTIEQCIKFVTA